MLQKSSGVIKKPKVIVFYGTEGSGKTEIMSKFPKPLFIDFEGGSKKYNVDRVMVTDKDYFAIKGELSNKEFVKGFQTLCIDSLDWVEQAMCKALCEKAKVTNVQDLGGYGKWVEVLLSEWNSFMSILKTLVDETQINVIMSAHCHVKKFDDPITMAPYDRYTIKLYEKHSAKVREWAEAVLFTNFQVFSKVSSSLDKKGKGIGNGTRMIFTEKRPSHDAKNRYSLPYEMPMDYDTLMSHMDASDEDMIKNLQQDIEALMVDVKDAVMLEKSKDYYEKNKEDLEKLKAIKQRLAIIVDGQEN